MEIWQEVDARSVQCRPHPGVEAEPGGEARFVRHARRRGEIAVARFERRMFQCARIAAGLVVVVVALSILCGTRLLTFRCNHGAARLTENKLRHYAQDAYPAWALEHPDRRCPPLLRDLNEYMNGDDVNDAWGMPIDFQCTTGADGSTRVWLRSAGEDRQFGSADDIAVP